MALAGHNAKQNRGGSWQIIHNPEVTGNNIYPGGNKVVAEALLTRKRDISKERSISPVAFNSTFRTSSCFEDKLELKTLNQMNSDHVA